MNTMMNRQKTNKNKLTIYIHVQCTCIYRTCIYSNTRTGREVTIYMFYSNTRTGREITIYM